MSNPKHLTPDDIASIRYVASTCDGPGYHGRAIGNLIRSLAHDVEQWQHHAPNIWDDCADVAGDLKGIGGVPFAAELHALNPYRTEGA